MKIKQSLAQQRQGADEADGEKCKFRIKRENFSLSIHKWRKSFKSLFRRQSKCKSFHVDIGRQDILLQKFFGPFSLFSPHWKISIQLCHCEQEGCWKRVRLLRVGNYVSSLLTRLWLIRFQIPPLELALVQPEFIQTRWSFFHFSFSTNNEHRAKQITVLSFSAFLLFAFSLLLCTWMLNFVCLTMRSFPFVRREREPLLFIWNEPIHVKGFHLPWHHSENVKALALHKGLRGNY